MSTTVCCVWVRGHVPFGVEYVTKLQNMVARRLADRPYRFVCVTDRPYQLRQLGIEAIGICNPHPLKGWWSKLECFNPAHGLKGRILYLDLDTLLVNRLGPIVDFPSSFALVPHAGSFEGKDGKAVVKRFNSSVMVWDAGTCDYLWERWTPAVADVLHGDQDWIGQEAHKASAMPLEWFPRISQVDGPNFGSARVILCKTPKNEEAAKRWFWFRERWK